MSGEGNDEKGFVIKDRRFFDEEGKTREAEVTGEEKVAPEEKPEPEKKPEAPPRREGPSPEEGGLQGGAEESMEDEYVLPEMNFSTFLLSLHTSALFHLGLISDPRTNKVEKNLPAAKQTIDILELLLKKTKGNLEDEERKLLDGILFELRMAYVKSTSAS